VTVSLGGIGTPTALTYGSGAFYVGATGAGSQQGLVLQDANANSTLTWANAIDTNGKTFFVNQAAPTSGNSTAATMTGVLSGTGNLTKAGAGQLILTGNNTYTGTTTVTSGTLVISGSSTGGGAYAVNSGGTLGGTGTIGLASNQNVVVSAGGRVQASSFDRLDLALSGTGTLDVSGALGSGTG
jgi:fibronectin-binding autotransporter adhesin